MVTKTAALITIHGMGRTKPNYNLDFRREVRRRLGSRGNRLHYGRVYYQGILQPNEDRVWKSMAGKLSWDSVRKFVLFGLADAAGLEANKHMPNSVYARAQVTIAKALFEAHQVIGNENPVVVVAHSLGGQVLSNYIWDAQNHRANPGSVRVGMWRNVQKSAQDIAGKRRLSKSDVKLLSGAEIQRLYTTGCNIPIFVAAHGINEIIPIAKTRPDFEWHNYYDKDDVLGWPLEDLSAPYRALVTDHRINAAQGFIGWLLKSWNPTSHSEYWGDDEVLDDLTTHLKSLT